MLPTVMAPNGHSFSHLPQPIQLTLQAFIETAPLSLFTQDTNTRLPLGPFFLSSIMFLGQAFVHAPQAVHFSSSTSGSPVSGFKWMASNWHAAHASEIFSVISLTLIVLINVPLYSLYSTYMTVVSDSCPSCFHPEFSIICVTLLRET